MAFIVTNPVSVGDYILKTDYDGLFDNDQFLHDSVLALNGAGGVVIGDTARANIKSIGRTDQTLSVDVLAGTNTAEDARIWMFGKSAGANMSILFVQNAAADAAKRQFIFRTANSAADLFSISSAGVNTFYNPADAADYVRVTADGTPQIDIVESGGNAVLLETGSLVFDYGGTAVIHQTRAAQLLDIRSDGDVNIRSDYDDAAPSVWQFNTLGHFMIPEADSASTTDGTIWMQSGVVYVRSGGATRNLSNVP